MNYINEINKNKRVLFRADAKPSIGIGDLMSLIYLSHYFEAESWECYFIIKNYSAGVQLAKKYGIRNIKILDIYVSIAEEVRAINDFVQKQKIKLLFFEITERKITEYKGLTNNVFKACVSFDGQILPDMDLVVDWDVEAHKFFKPEHFPKTKFLLGPKYVILPFNFDYDRISNRKYRFPPEILLISMGGADEFNFTQKIVDILIKIKTKMKINIIVGSGYEHRKKLDESLKGSNLHYEIKQNISNMFEEYMNCDIAVAAGGLTASELVASRTPSVLIATYEHQVARCRYFCEQGWVSYLGFKKFEESALYNSIYYSREKPSNKKLFNTKKIVEICNGLFL